jgi:cell wall assembly regulator SMI1
LREGGGGLASDGMRDWETFKTLFWNQDASVGVQPPLTEEMLLRAERVLGVRLPESLVELLRVQNGGVVSDDFNAFPSPRPTSWAHDHVPFEEVNGIGDVNEADARSGNVYAGAGILDTPYLIREWEMPTGLVLLTGDGHWWICLDYRGRGPDDEPTVTWYDNEMDEDIELAPSFSSFLEGLCNREENFPI